MRPLNQPDVNQVARGRGRETHSEGAEGDSSEGGTAVPSLAESSGNLSLDSTPSLVNSDQSRSSGPPSLASDSPRRMGGGGERPASRNVDSRASHEGVRRGRSSGASHRRRADAASGGRVPGAVAEDAVVRGSSGNLADGEGRPAGRPGLARLITAPVGWVLGGAWHVGSNVLRRVFS